MCSVTMVFLSFAVFLLALLVPAIPAYLIYRRFPDTTVAAEGPLKGLKIKATGAFAAYLVTVILGFVFAEKTHALIESNTSPTWTIKARVQLRDAAGELLDGRELLQALHVAIRPDTKDLSDEYVSVKLPGGQPWPHPRLRFELPQFGWTTVDLNTLSADDEAVTMNDADRVLELKSPVVIKAIPEKYAKAAETPLEPLLPHAGPPPTSERGALPLDAH